MLVCVPVPGAEPARRHSLNICCLWLNQSVSRAQGKDLPKQKHIAQPRYHSRPASLGPQNHDKGQEQGVASGKGPQRGTGCCRLGREGAREESLMENSEMFQSHKKGQRRRRGSYRPV